METTKFLFRQIVCYFRQFVFVILIEAPESKRIKTESIRKLSYCLNYSGTRFSSTAFEITQFPHGFRLNLYLYIQDIYI